MIAFRMTRPAAILALLLAGASGALDGSASAQLPEPRLTSLSRPGSRVGETAEVALRGSNLEGVTQLWFDHPGIKAAHVKDLSFRVVSAPAVPLGHHDVRAIGTYGVSNPRTFVLGDRPESVEVEPNNTPEKANRIVVNTVTNGELSGGADIDCFAFAGKKGQRLFFDVEAERLDSPLDATIRLYSPSGAELAESRDYFGVDPFLDTTLPADGRYVVKIHDAIYAGSPDHTYRLTVHDGPHLDAILPAAAQPGTVTAFTLFGRGLGAAAAPDPQSTGNGSALARLNVSIRVPIEALLAPDLSARARLFVPSTAVRQRQGFEYTHVRASPEGAAPVVSNPLFIARAAGPVILEHEPNNDDAHAQVVVPPCDISATFAQTGDADLFRFQAHKGDIWWIEAIAERMGSMADPAFVVQKVGPKGQPAQDLETGDDVPDAGAGPRFTSQTVDAAVRWQVPDDGLYQVLASDLYASQRGHARLTYRLVIRREEPDFELVAVPESPTGIDSVTVRAGGRTAAYVAAIRKDGFGGPIRVEARALPAGVRAANVTIGPGQAIAPIVFEADPAAKTTVGTVAITGRGRFGDRKEALEYVAGASSLGPDITQTAMAAAMTGPPNPNAETVAPARLTHGCVVAVREEPAPLAISAAPTTFVLAQGHHLDLDLAVTRRAGFVEAVAVTVIALPPNMPEAGVTIPKEAKTAVLPLFVPREVPPGIYTILVRATGAYPFNKDPKAKEKPNVNLTEPSNPITVFVRSAPLNLSVDNKGGALKAGASLEIGVTITRQNGFAGNVALSLAAPAKFKLSAAPVELAAGQTQATLVIQAAKDSPAGAAPGVYARATATVPGEAIEVEENVGLTIGKP
jgi:hypothetical protein